MPRNKNVVQETERTLAAEIMTRSFGNFTPAVVQYHNTVQPTWKSINETAEYVVLSFVLFLLLLLFVLVGHVCMKLWPKKEDSDQYSRTDNRNTSMRTDVAITLDTNSSIEIVDDKSSYYRCTGHTYMEKNSGLALEENIVELIEGYVSPDVRTSDV